MSNEQTDKRTASEKIADLERGLMAMYQAADNMARDLMTAKDAIKLLGNKVDAIVKASGSGQALNDEVIAKIMVDNNVEELQQKVGNLIKQGILKASEAVTENSFVVGKEVNAEGEVVNPRLQFALSNLPDKALQDKFLNAKAGDVLNLQEGKLQYQILEVYEIVTPNSEQAVEAAPAEQEAQAEVSAPAQEQAQQADSSTGTAAN